MVHKKFSEVRVHLEQAIARGDTESARRIAQDAGIDLDACTRELEDRATATSTPPQMTRRPASHTESEAIYDTY